MKLSIGQSKRLACLSSMRAIPQRSRTICNVLEEPRGLERSKGELEAIFKRAESGEEGVSLELFNSFITGFRSQPEERDYWVPSSSIEGQIPLDLCGTLLRNGPGLMERGGVKLNQPFDGDGLVSKFSFKDGRVHFMNRFVKTAGYLEEQKAGRFINKSVFSTNNPTGRLVFNPFDLSFKNCANTNLVDLAGDLYAFHEAGLPHKLDGRTLETKGEVDFFGQTRGLPGPVYVAAHYKQWTDPRTGEKRFIDFAWSIQGQDATVRVFELDSQGRPLASQTRVLKGAGFGFYHDFVVTDNYYVFFENPTRLNWSKLFSEYLLGKCSLAECLEYHKELPVNIHVFPRNNTGASGTRGGTGGTEELGPVRSFRAPPFFVFHFVNGYERTVEPYPGVFKRELVIDLVAWDDFSFTTANLEKVQPEYFNGGLRSELSRAVIGLDTGLVKYGRHSDRVCEFPSIHPSWMGRRHRYAYVSASPVRHPVRWSPNQTITKFDFETGRETVWYAGKNRFPQEPVFVPKPGGTSEEDGYLMALVYDGNRRTTDLVILDAADLDKGPVALIHLPHHLPYGLHGAWTQNYLGPMIG